MSASNAANIQCETCHAREKGIFCELAHPDLHDLSTHKVSNRYKRGQTLFFQGNPPYGVYCINEGKVKVFRTSSDGRESVLRIAAAGDIVGHRSLFTEQYYSASATVLEDAYICFIDKKYIMKLVEENPKVAMALIKQLGKEMGAAENKVASMFQKNVRERLAELILLLKESYGTKTAKGYRLDIKLTREEMASMIGTANETLIRFMSELKDEGLISQEGKVIYLLNEEKLVEFANLDF